MDGLKPGQRKILFSCLKRNLKNEIKVAQLAGYISEHAAYHHGETSLIGTIINMAQNFVGSNNINLLHPVGQFGTRNQGGKDAASARYIFTKLSNITRTIFHPDDDLVLNWLNDDGTWIEPETYYPIIPLTLINGAEGIGTGWSTSIPNYNPLDVINNLRRMLQNQEPGMIKPWYKNWNGKIKWDETKQKFDTQGIFDIIDYTNKRVRITELPVGYWTERCKNDLEKLCINDEIKDIRIGHTDWTVDFDIRFTEKFEWPLNPELDENFKKKLKLIKTISLNNMVLFDINGKQKKYISVIEILKEFFVTRLLMYGKRKETLIIMTKNHLRNLTNKARFIKLVIENKINLLNQPKSSILKEIKNLG